MNSSTKSIIAAFSLLILLALFFWGLGEALVPLIFSFILVYLFFPVVQKLEQKGMNRNISVVILFVFTVLLLTILLSSFLPSLIKESQDFIKELPQNLTKVLHKTETTLNNLGYDINLSKEKVEAYLKEHFSGASESLLKSFANALKSSFSGITNLLISIINLFLVPLFFFYIINDFEKISKEIKNLIPKSIRPKITHYFNLTNDVLSGYIRGQLLVAFTLSILYAFGLSIIGLKFGFLIGILSGLVSIIPYAGFSLGFGAALLVGFANYGGIGQVLGIVIVFVSIQGLEGTFITPKLVGNKVGLSAFATMLSLIIGGNLFGLVGMLIAIPFAAILKSVIKELISEYKNSDFYQTNT